MLTECVKSAAVNYSWPPRVRTRFSPHETASRPLSDNLSSTLPFTGAEQQWFNLYYGSELHSNNSLLAPLQVSTSIREHRHGRLLTLTSAITDEESLQLTTLIMFCDCSQFMTIISLEYGLCGFNGNIPGSVTLLLITTEFDFITLFEL